ncbi:MAG: LamG-like jellyroll fold domain-containing protein [Thermoguttaceae bacterium]|jgi:hypothetical protein|nr:LamG-like jellyroll fold domain-containing protein [Thermoguttaceae bacterium]
MPNRNILPWGAVSILLLIWLPLIVAAASASQHEPGAPPMYVRDATLPETLLATRQCYATWLAEQPIARQAVEVAPWLATPVMLADVLDGLVQPATGLDLDASISDGQPLWTPQDKLPDATVVPLPDNSPGKTLCLTRIITAKQPVTLTVGVGGGDRLDLWLNGRKIASAGTHLNVGRYGCGRWVDGTRVDQLLADLDLQAGENRLVVRVATAEEPSWFFSPSPNPAPRLWEQFRRDFPPTENPLLDLVPADWFEPAGWLAAGGTQSEEQLVDRLAFDCGDDEAAIRNELDRLRREPAGRNDRRWLDLCVKASVAARLHVDLARLRAAVAALGHAHPDEYPAAELLGELDRYRQRVSAGVAATLDPANPDTGALMAEMPRMQRRMLVELSPLLRGREILFGKRYTYNSMHYYDDFQHIARFGGNLCVLSMADGSVRELVPQLEGGVFDRYDLSFDGKRIAFGYRRPRPEGYRIWEVGVDGSGLRQVTHPPDDEEERIAKYGQTSFGDGHYGLMGYRFWTDDVHPCYLPDGGLCFASTRGERGVLCTPAHYLACTNLFRIDAGGGGLRPLSYGALSEFTPTMMEDGRILYNRWEYVYKGIAAVQPLWTMRPDGSGSEEFYGNNIANPGVFWQARLLPGHPRKAVCIGCGHEPMGVGPVLLVDLDRGKREPAAMTSLTPNVRTEGLRGLYQLRNGAWREDIFGPFYADPYPLSDQFFLVSCNPEGRYNDQAAYGLYLLDVFGNRVPVYHDPEISSWQPMLLGPRPRPPVLPALSRPAEPEQLTVDGEAIPAVPGKAVVFLADVYRGLDGVEPGAVKYVRVMEQVPKTWVAEVDSRRGEDRSADGFGGHLVVSHNTHIWVAVLWGIVPVEEDGSACFEVPAGRNLFFQALDENFMEVQRMRTFVSFEPGEARSCVGCHEHRTQAPEARLAMAFGRPPAALAAQPGEVAPRPLHYPCDIQPIFDRHCVDCHDGKNPQVDLDLRSDLTTLFSVSYESIFKSKLVHAIQEWAGHTYSMANAEAVAPYSLGSHRSHLVDVLRVGHHDVVLSRNEWIRLVTWIDCGAPYYGSYFGRRHLKYRGQDDFRPVPTVESAMGIPPALPELPTPEPLPARLLAHWPLDGEGDTESDVSGEASALKVVAAPPAPGQEGRGGRRFEGNGYLEAGGLGGHEAVSIALWVKFHSLKSRWSPLLFCHDAKPGTLHLSLLPDGTPNVAVNTDGANWTHAKANTPLKPGQWHHVTLVCDGRHGGHIRFYLDGKPAKTHRPGLGLPLDLYGFRVGAYNRWENDPSENFHGELADLRIYSGMLTDEEVARLPDATGKGL